MIKQYMCFTTRSFKRYRELRGEMMTVLKTVEKSKHEIGKGGSEVSYMKTDLSHSEARS